MLQFIHLFAVHQVDCLSPNRRIPRNRALWRGVLWVVCVLVLTGCFRRSQATNMTFDLKELLPAEWSSVGAVREINIDNDDAVERLVFFRYDKSPQTVLAPSAR